MPKVSYGRWMEPHHPESINLIALNTVRYCRNQNFPHAKVTKDARGSRQLNFPCLARTANFAFITLSLRPLRPLREAKQTVAPITLENG